MSNSMVIKEWFGLDVLDEMLKKKKEEEVKHDQGIC